MASTETRRIRGRIDVHPRGFGFLIVEPPLPDAPRSAFVAPPELNPFFADDLVTAVLSSSGDGRFTASGLSLVSRVRQRVYGEVALHRGVPHLRVDREVANTDWPLQTGGAEVQVGEAVIARIDGDHLVLEKRLGPDDDRALERVLARHGVTGEFPPEALAAAEEARRRPHALGGARRDLREIPTVTVDAASTRDIDDAISVLPAGPDGALRLFVSIADVSEFVTEDSPLDRVARDRATSVYLADRVLPMLPESLSAGWLSLLPGEERSCLTAELRVDPEGKVTAVDVYESLIRSHARLTYIEVASFLDRGEVLPSLEPVRQALPWFRAASARLAVARAQRGGIEMARDEARLTFSETGEVSGVEAVASTSAHAMIERFMVAANEAIATWLFDRGVPAPFRVQDPPDAERVADLDLFARSAGLAAGFGRKLTPLALAAFDRQITGIAGEPALRSVLRRTLGRARYTVAPSVHFGLAAPRYLHFTSPIRRYADLAVHRTIKQYLGGRRDFVADDPRVEELAGHLNLRAREAGHAEADRHRTLEARLMANRVGDRFSARITRVRPFGLLVQLDGALVEGLLPVDALPGGPYRTDPRETTLSSGEKSFTVGMPLVVRVASTDEGLGRIELALANP